MWGRAQKRWGILRIEEKEREKKELKTEILEYMAESQDCRKSCPVGSFQGWGGQSNFKHRNTKYCILSWLQCYDTHLLHHLIPSAESNSPYSIVWRCLKNSVGAIKGSGSDSLLHFFHSSGTLGKFLNELQFFELTFNNCFSKNC